MLDFPKLTYNVRRQSGRGELLCCNVTPMLTEPCTFPAEAGLQMTFPECGSSLTVCASMLQLMSVSSIDISEIQAKSSQNGFETKTFLSVLATRHNNFFSKYASFKKATNL